MGRRRGSIQPPTERRPSWLARVSLGPDPAGRSRPRLSKTFASKREAEQWVTLQLGRADGGERVPTGRAAKVTLRDWLAEWDATWSGDCSPQTVAQEQQTRRLYLPPALLDRQLRDLSAAEIQRHLQDLQARGLAPATVHRVYRLLRARLNDAVEQGQLLRSPMVRVKPPRVPRREGRTLTAAEARIFLELCESNRYGALWATLLLTGLRPSEALALRWPDFTGEQLHIRRALIRTGKTVRFDETKTRRERVVPVPPYLQRVLRAHRAGQHTRRLQLGSEYTGDLVFASTFGAPLQWATVNGRYLASLVGRLALRMVGQPDSPPKGGRGQGGALAAYQERTAAALVKTGLGRFRGYDTRHTAATLMIENGESPKTVAEVLGHANVTTTLQTYTHVSGDLMERAAGRLEDAIMGTDTPRRALR